MTSLQLGGYDPLDAQLDDAALPPLRSTGRSWLRRRFAGWSATSVPVASLLLVGVALGPRGISLLSPSVLTLLDPAIPVALAALGALVGLSVDVRGKGEARALAAATVESSLTAAAVAACFILFPPAVLTSSGVPPLLLAMGLGLCAATSLAVPGGSAAGPQPIWLRVIEFDAIVPILAGGLLLAAMREGVTAAALVLAGKAALVAIVLAGAGWLLLFRAVSDTEQRVFAFASMLLIGGAADYLALSALLSGLVAGVCWQLAGSQTGESLRRDTLHFQHSLLVFVLVVAGANTNFGLTSSAIAAVYVFLRTTAKLLGGAAAGRIAGAAGVRVFGLHLLPPGVFGVALALDTVHATGADANVLLTIVVLGTIGAELVAGLDWPRESAS